MVSRDGLSRNPQAQPAKGAPPVKRAFRNKNTHELVSSREEGAGGALEGGQAARSEGDLPGPGSTRANGDLPRPGPSWKSVSPSLPRGASWDSEKHHPRPGVGVWWRGPSQPTAAVTQGSRQPRPPCPYGRSKSNLSLRSFIPTVRQTFLGFGTKYRNK